MASNYTDYISEMSDDITTCLENMTAQPILFIGSGFSQRYFGSPNWEQLLQTLATPCPIINKDYAYYKQKCNDLIEIGSIFSNAYRDWAWGDGRDQFPDELFEADQTQEIYFKHKIATFFEKQKEKQFPSKFAKEIELLKAIQPHTIITTNYDCFLETLFDRYKPIIGQSILRANYVSYGEILKIHGCSSKPDSIVITKDDYELFASKKKYLSAKLLTYFAEHPLVFIGYSAEDPNIRSILSDIDEIISTEGELIENIYFVEWSEGIENKTSFMKEKLINVGNGKSVRVKCLVASQFSWIFEAFKASDTLKDLDPKVLRTLLSRFHKMVRHDIPKNVIEVNYQNLEAIASDENGIATLLGITTIDDPSQMNAQYPYTLTQVGKKLGYSFWHKANQLITKVYEDTGYELKKSDNKYHIRVKLGPNNGIHKYSEELVGLLERARKSNQYEIDSGSE